MKKTHIINTVEVIEVEEKNVISSYASYLKKTSIKPLYNKRIIGPNCFSEFYSAQYLKASHDFVFWSANKITRPSTDSGEDIIALSNNSPYLKIIEVKGNESFDGLNKNRDHVTTALNKSFFNGETKQNSLINTYDKEKKVLNENAQNKILEIINEAKKTNLFPDAHAEIHDYTFWNKSASTTFAVNTTSTIKSINDRKDITVDQRIFDIKINKPFDIEDPYE